jgi:hypothetical protein
MTGLAGFGGSQQYIGRLIFNFRNTLRARDRFFNQQMIHQIFLVINLS